MNRETLSQEKKKREVGEGGVKIRRKKRKVPRTV